jgi:hypothetical protein
MPRTSPVGLLVDVEEPARRVTRTPKTWPHCPNRHAEDFRRLVIGHSLETDEQKHLTLPLWEMAKRAFKLADLQANGVIRQPPGIAAASEEAGLASNVLYFLAVQTPQPDDGWKDVPETDEEHERYASNGRADPRWGGDLGQDDIDITGEPQGQGYGGTGNKPAPHAMHLIGILPREDDAVIGGRRHQENHCYRNAA